MAKYCPKCGAAMADHAHFCQACGTSLDRPVIPAAQGSEPTGPAVSPVIQPSGKPRIEEKKRKIPVLLVLVLLWCAVLAWIGFHTIPENLRIASLPPQTFITYDDAEEVPEPETAEEDEVIEYHVWYDWLYGESDHPQGE